eukprot:TRINITY_DN12766_c0_g3_i1.p2 TRINITY_DN12766_c0_g3~~TRINITY_DN12766_c0_g3_i1.p2  ORF type:complete len:135 (-),score=30.74 TRINITY_DN12766_c0_g3_i1:187-591(-)
MLKEEGKDIEDVLAIDAYKMELERIKYLLKAYFRTRLGKIEQQLFHLVETRESIASNVSTNEWKYVLTLCALRGKYFKESFMKMIPTIYREFEENKPISAEMAAAPKDSYIFVRVVQSGSISQFANTYIPNITD